jgi:uncharacterized membrane protein
MMRNWWTFIAVAGLLIALTFVVLAPSAPEDANGHGHLVFMQTTAVLSLLPLAMVGGAGLWIWKRSRERLDLEDYVEDRGRR